MSSTGSAIALVGAALLVVGSVGIASAAPTVKVAARTYEQRFTAFWTNKPASPAGAVTYTDVAVNAGARFSIQAGSGYAPTGPVVSAGPTVTYTQYHYVGAVRQVTFDRVVTSTAIPAVDDGLWSGYAGNFVPGVGWVEIGCAGYGSTLRGSWTWTGGSSPGSGYTYVETGRSRACTPTLYLNGVAQPGRTSPSYGAIGAYTVTRVNVWPR